MARMPMTTALALALGALGALGAPAPGQAQEAEMPFYISGRAAGLFVPEVDLDLTTTTGTKYSGELELNTGFLVGLDFGYRFGDFRVEYGFDYQRNEVDSYSLSSGQTTSGVSGSLSQFGTWLSGYYDLPLGESRVHPYVGAGIGYTRAMIDLDATHGGTAYSSDASSNGVGVQGAVGVAVDVTDTISLFGDYRYRHVWGDEFDDNNLTGDAELGGHQFGLGMRYSFGSGSSTQERSLAQAREENERPMHRSRRATRDHYAYGQSNAASATRQNTAMTNTRQAYNGYGDSRFRRYEGGVSSSAGRGEVSTNAGRGEVPTNADWGQVPTNAGWGTMNSQRRFPLEVYSDDPFPAQNRRPTPSPTRGTTYASRGSYGVQLAAYRKPGSADKGWSEMQRKYGDLLRGFQPEVRKVRVPGKGTFHRLYAGRLSQTEANNLCRQIKNRGQWCQVSQI